MARTANDADHAQELKRDELDGPLVLNLGLGKTATASAPPLDGDQGGEAAGDAAAGTSGNVGQYAPKPKLPAQRTTHLAHPAASIFRDDDEGQSCHGMYGYI